MKATAEMALSRAIALHEGGRLAEEEKIYREILQQNPRHSGVLYLLGLIALSSQRFQRAVDLISRSIRINPDFAPAHCNLGIALAASDRRGEALARYDAAIARQPDFAEAHYNRGLLLTALGRQDEAIDSLGRTLQLRPDDVEARSARGLALNAAGRLPDALADFDAAIAQRPDHAKSHNNRGTTLTLLKRPDDALASFDRAVALQPDLADAWCNRGEALHELNRIEEAIASFDKAISLRQDFAEAYFGRGLSRLTVGRYRDGFRDQEWRARRAGAPPARSFRQKPWLGESAVAGRRLFIHPELYLGDMVQFCRYAAVAAERGARVVLGVQRPLLGLLRTLHPGVTLIEAGETPSRFDLHCPLLSLPLAFGTTIETVPNAVPYLRAEPDRAARWAATLGDDGFKIGICWQGNPNRAELDRDVPLSAFAPLGRMRGVRLVSLQTGDGLDQLGALPDDVRVEHFEDTSDDGMRPFQEMAAMIANLDLVVTTDTVVAHVAGAMGRPAWVLLKQVPDWRWGQGDTTPWYPTLRLFRQSRRGDWGGVMDQVIEAIGAVEKTRTSTRLPPQAPQACASTIPPRPHRADTGI